MIGRKQEQQQLQACLDSNQSEFLIVYGRRRIGKTYLVREFFHNQFAFSYVGGHQLTKKEQLQYFAEALQEYSNTLVAPSLNDWHAAFAYLKELLKSKPEEERKVLFIDEMPWIDTPHSDFVKELEMFWNGWAATRKDIILIACGSATSWMTDHLLSNQGGLHNRITRQIYLRPFTLQETESLLEESGCHWDRFQITQCYMVLGGVPYYLKMIDGRQSLAQNIDRLFFEKNAPLRNEFQELYPALFNNSDKYITIVEALAAKREGMEKTEISKTTKISGGWLTKILTNLEQCDFIVGYSRFGNKVKNAIYRLTDFYSLFYLKFVAPHNHNDTHFWMHSLQAPGIAAWQGLTYKLVCLSHVEQIKRKLGINGILTSVSCWRNKGQATGEEPKPRTQIDLVIDRADRIINLCEVKFTNEPYAITSDYAMRLRTRMAIFKTETKTRKAVATTFITTFGILPGKHSSIAQSEVTMDDLYG